MISSVLKKKTSAMGRFLEARLDHITET